MNNSISGPRTPAEALPELVDLWLEDPEAMAALITRWSGEERDWIEGARLAADEVRAGRQSLESAKAAVAAVARRHFPPVRPADTRPKNTSPARTAPRARTQRSARRGTVKTAQDPGDPDPDPDPVGEAIERLLDNAPPFSVGQRDLLGRLLGGAL